MCGISAIVGFTEQGKAKLKNIQGCVAHLKHRGPDNQHYFIGENYALGHARLSIIDLSAASDQPFISHDERFKIVYNGELFNYKELREELMGKGHKFYTDGDVEVLVNLYKEFGKECLQKINGFFAFVLFDKENNSFFAARDRFGVKPFYYYSDADLFACASEIKALQNAIGQKPIDKTALLAYLQLTYVPETITILEGVHKLEPGHCLEIKNGKVRKEKYYAVKLSVTYQTKKDPAKEFLQILEKAVAARMVSDVPVGSFLSGGIDSSVITAIAAGQNKELKTFSIGFKDNKHFDESVYAEIVARRYKTEHQTFHLTEAEAEGELDGFFDSIDEPFADSSAFNVYVLSKKTKQHVKVVLSGDGADELFAGYNKHRAEWIVRHEKARSFLLKNSGTLSKLIPSSRNNKLANRARQIQRFSSGARMSAPERYWRWASFYEEKKAGKLLHANHSVLANFQKVKDHFTNGITADYNSVLLADVGLVLPADMLVKVDRMSMAHGLEVRNPFLDHRMVEFAFSLEAKYKIDGRTQKKIVKESCRHLLPDEILHRRKQGFETPVQHWLQGVLRKKVEELCLDKELIKHQGLFDPDELKRLVKKALSPDAGDTTSVVWAVLVFNHWYKRNML
jgi:asparagine synthase (glutamine-hydrolysing)